MENTLPYVSFKIRDHRNSFEALVSLSSSASICTANFALNTGYSINPITPRLKLCTALGSNHAVDILGELKLPLLFPLASGKIASIKTPFYVANIHDKNEITLGSPFLHSIKAKYVTRDSILLSIDECIPVIQK